MAKNGFSESTQTILAVTSITPYDTLTSVDAQQLVDAGISLCVTDLDGVVGAYDQGPDRNCLLRLCEINEALPKGAIIITNNRRAPVNELPNHIPVRSFKLAQPWGFKPLPFAIKGELQKRDVRGEDVVAFGDGLSDILAYKLAGIGRVGLISSMGAHKVQEFVHRNIYHRVSPLAAAAIRFTKAV